MQNFGLYQLENLQRGQAKFLTVILTSETVHEANQIPTHPLLKKDIVTSSGEAIAVIEKKLGESQYPAWWPIVLISEAGEADAQIAGELTAKGYINVYSYRGGRTSLLAESAGNAAN